MSNIKTKDFKADIQIRGIELLNGTLNFPNVLIETITKYNFNLVIESRIDEKNKFVFVIVKIEIKNDDLSITLGSLSVSCIYEITNFEEVILPNSKGILEIPQQLLEILNSISISTVRGVMFSTFKGTFLHNAILPITDPKQIQKLDPTIEVKK